jgi:hypothetical protein
VSDHVSTTKTGAGTCRSLSGCRPLLSGLPHFPSPPPMSLGLSGMHAWCTCTLIHEREGERGGETITCNLANVREENKVQKTRHSPKACHPKLSTMMQQICTLAFRELLCLPQPARPNCGAGPAMPLAQSPAQVSHPCVSSCGRPHSGLSAPPAFLFFSSGHHEAPGGGGG